MGGWGDVAFFSGGVEGLLAGGGWRVQAKRGPARVAAAASCAAGRRATGRRIQAAAAAVAALEGNARLQAAAGADLGRLLGAGGDGQLDILGAL